MLIFCDLDGTLINSFRRHEVLLNDLLAERGLPSVNSSYLQEKREGLNNRGFLQRRGSGSPEEQEEICRAWTERIEMEKYLQLDEWIEPHCRKVEELHAFGHRIIILSARQNVPWITKKVRNKFPFLREEDIRIVSPFEAAAQKRKAVIEISAGRPGIFIGDSEADAAACEGTHVLPWLLNTGFRSEMFWNRLSLSSHASLDNVELLIQEASKKMSQMSAE